MVTAAAPVYTSSGSRMEKPTVESPQTDSSPAKGPDGYVDRTALQSLKPIERKPRMSQEIAQKIQSLIRNGTLKPGDQLPKERELAERLGVGRGSLREGLNILEAMGFIEIRPREGSFVRDTSPRLAREPIQIMIEEEPDKLFELNEVRKWIDGQGAAIAAQRATPEDIEALWEVYHQMERIYQKGDYFKAEYDWLYSSFFRVLAQSTHNDLFYQLMRTFGKMVKGTRAYVRNLFEREPRLAKRLLKQHRNIVEAIAAYDPVKAKRSVISHIDLIDRKIQELIGDEQTS